MRFSLVLFLAFCALLAFLLALNVARAQEREENPQQENPGSASEEQNLLEAVAGKMKTAERRLSEEDSGEETQKKQLEAIGLLRDLIRKAEEAIPHEVPEESPDQNGSNPAQPGSQVQKALIGKTQAQQKVKWKVSGGAMSKIWGRLRPCDREEALSASKEEFPQKYKRLLEMYYRWLLKR